MKKVLTPFNISLLIPTKAQLSLLGQVTSHEIFEGLGGNFHEQGLFSVSIFGRVGSNARESNFGYIHLGLSVLHPLVYRTLIKLKRFYEQLIQGHAYAKWDDAAKDFVPAGELEGQTGMTFFLQHWQKINFKTSESSARKIRLDLIEKYKHRALLTDMLVSPAAFRDVEIGADGRTAMDEINDKYRYLLNQSKGIPEHFGPNDDVSIYDRKRVAMQFTCNEIYEHYERLLSGKGGYIQAKWASRRIFNGTRNVLTSMDTNSADLDSAHRVRFNDATVGLYQSARGILPKVIHGIQQNTPVREIFGGLSNRVELVNQKTLLREWVELNSEEVDRWTTVKGVDKTINEIEVAEKRTRPVIVGGHYLYLIYADDAGNYRILRDISELPADKERRFVRPITYGEMIYLCCLDVWRETAGFVTRYPVENYNSSIPIMLYVKTTVKGEVRYPLNDNWERDESLPVAVEFPVFELGKPASWHDSVAVSPAYLSSLGADFDGDTVSILLVYSDEAVAEAKAFFDSRIAYIKAGGGLAFSANIHTLNLTLRYMTGEPKSRV
jgi:hypothetical protein